MYTERRDRSINDENRNHKSQVKLLETFKRWEKRFSENYCERHARERKLQVDDNSKEVYM